MLFNRNISIIMVFIFFLGYIGSAPFLPLQAENGSLQDPLIGASAAIILDSGNQVRPSLAYNQRQNEFLLVWETLTEYHGLTYGSVGAQRLTAEGDPIASPLAITTIYAGAHRPDVVFNPVTNEYLVVWHEFLAGAASDIRAQRISGDGQLEGSAYSVVTANESQHTPAIACDTRNGSYYVVWNDLRDENIHGVLLGPDGRPSIPERMLSQAPEIEDRSEVAYNAASASYTVAWTRYWDDPDFGDMVLQLVRQDGALMGGNVVLMGEDIKEAPALASIGKDETTLLLWHDNRYFRGSDIRGVLISSDGVLAPEAVVEEAVSEQLDAAVASNGQDGYLSVWQDRRHTWDKPEPKPHDIYARCIDQNGQAGSEGGAVYVGTGDQGFPAVAYSTISRQYLVVWQDDRGGNYDIYGAVWKGCAATQFSVFLPVISK